MRDHREWLERRGLALSEHAGTLQRGQWANLLLIAEAFGMDSPQMKAALADYTRSWAPHTPDINTDEK